MSVSLDYAKLSERGRAEEGASRHGESRRVSRSRVPPDLVWSRHDEALYFNGEPAPGDRYIFRMSIPNGKVERLASLKGRTEWGWLGLTPDDSPLIARSVSREEVYGLSVNWP